MALLSLTSQSNLSTTMSFEMKDPRDLREKKAQRDSDGEQSNPSMTERIDNSVTIWASVAATWSVV
jgi:hypothetical protein